MRKVIDMMVLFIVIYLLVMIGRWFVLPHLKVFPNIPPSWLWNSVVGVILAICTAIFHYIVIALVIIYIIWIIIKKFVPNFPIPFKKILLRMPPFRPLERAGILPLIDDVRKILFSVMPLSDRVEKAGRSIGRFLSRSFGFVMGMAGIKVGGVASPSRRQKVSEEDDSALSPAEELEVQQAYLQCIEESITPITPEMTTMEKQKLALTNQQNSVICKLRQLDIQSRIIGDKVEEQLAKSKKRKKKR